MAESNYENSESIIEPMPLSEPEYADFIISDPESTIETLSYSTVAEFHVENLDIVPPSFIGFSIAASLVLVSLGVDALLNIFRRQ